MYEWSVWPVSLKTAGMYGFCPRQAARRLNERLIDLCNTVMVCMWACVFLSLRHASQIFRVSL